MAAARADRALTRTTRPRSQWTTETPRKEERREVRVAKHGPQTETCPETGKQQKFTGRNLDGIELTFLTR